MQPSRYVTSGEPAALRARVGELLGEDVAVEGVVWQGGEFISR